jgi:hypothetical protein
MPLSTDEIDRQIAICEAATPGPWRFREEEFYQKAIFKNRKTRKRVRRQFLIHLAGPVNSCLSGGELHADPWDYDAVLILPSISVKSNSICFIGLSKQDRAFIEAASSGYKAVLESLREIKDLFEQAQAVVEAEKRNE